MGNQLRIAKATKNALTATNPNDFLFHSLYNTFKILASGNLSSQTVDADPKTFSVVHGLGSIPSVYAIAKFPDGYAVPPGDKERADNTKPVERYFRVEVDNTNVYFLFYKGGTSNYSISLKYYIFETPL